MSRFFSNRFLLTTETDRGRSPIKEEALFDDLVDEAVHNCVLYEPMRRKTCLNCEWMTKGEENEVDESKISI